MNTYEIAFKGRKIGAIGIIYRMTETVEAPTAKEAEHKLYDRFEHISVGRISLLNPTEEN